MKKLFILAILICLNYTVIFGQSNYQEFSRQAQQNLQTIEQEYQRLTDMRKTAIEDTTFRRYQRRLNTLQREIEAAAREVESAIKRPATKENIDRAFANYENRINTYKSVEQQLREWIGGLQ